MAVSGKENDAVTAAETAEATATPEVEIAMFGRSATANRIRALTALADTVPGLKYERFEPGRPGVFVMALSGVEIRLVLSQVEVFVATFRIARLHTKRSLTPDDVAKIVVHQF